MEVEIPSDKTGSITALVDSKLLKISRSKPEHLKVQNEISKMEKERMRKNGEFNKVIRQSPKLQECKQLLDNI